MSRLLDYVSWATGQRVENAPMRDARRAFERTYFLGLLASKSGNVTAVLEASGMGDRSALYRKMRHVGISVEQIRRIRQDAGRQA